MNLLNCLRTCFKGDHKELPYAVSFNDKEYFSNVCWFRNDIPAMLGVDYTTYFHRHEDYYVHTTSEKIARDIMVEGYIDRDYFNEDGSVGRAIYTFPAKSGRCYLNEDLVVLLFKTSSPHFHIVGSNESIHCLGESVFIEDRIYIDDCKILSKEDYKIYISDNFDYTESLIHYFGISKEEISEYGISDVTVDTLKEIVSKNHASSCFDFNFYNLFQKDFGNTFTKSMKTTNMFREG